MTVALLQVIAQSKCPRKTWLVVDLHRFIMVYHGLSSKKRRTLTVKEFCPNADLMIWSTASWTSDLTDNASMHHDAGPNLQISSYWCAHVDVKGFHKATLWKSGIQNGNHWDFTRTSQEHHSSKRSIHKKKPRLFNGAGPHIPWLFIAIARLAAAWRRSHGCFDLLHPPSGPWDTEWDAKKWHSELVIYITCSI